MFGSNVSRRGRGSAALHHRTAYCEVLERRVLLAGGSFPSPAFLGAFDGGWNFLTNQPAGNLPSSLDGRNYPAGAIPQYTLEFDGASGQIPLLNVSFGETLTPAKMPQFSDFSISVLQGRYSTGLLEAVASKQTIAQVTIHGNDASGRETRRWTLEIAKLSSYTSSDAAGDSSPAFESFSIHFKRITAQTFAYDAHGIALPPRTVDYDTQTGDHDSVDFGHATFPPAGQPEQLLDLGSGQVAIQSFNWNETNATSISTPGDFSFTASAGAASLGLFSAVFTGDPIAQVTLYVRDAAGHIVTQWNLEDVTVTGYQSGANAGDMGPIDVFSLRPTRVQEVHNTYNASGTLTATNAAGWDYDTNKSFGSDSSNLGNTYAPGTEPHNALQIDGKAPLIPINSFSWGLSHELGSPTDVGEFSLSMDSAAYSTGLFRETANSSGHNATLITRDASGREIMRYILSQVHFTSYTTQDIAGDGASAAESVTLEFSVVQTEFTPYVNNIAQPMIVAKWSDLDHTGTGAALVGDAYAPGTEPPLALQVGSTLIPIDSLNWGVALPGNGGAQAGTFDVSFARGRWSPGIFGSVGVGTSYPAASIITRDASGRITARWKLTDLTVASYTTSGAGLFTSDGAAFTFSSIQRVIEQYDAGTGVTSVYAGGYDFAAAQPTSDAGTLGHTLSGLTYAGGAEPEYTIEFDGVSGLIPIQAMSWSEALTGQTPQFAPFILTLPSGRYDTGLVYYATKGTSLPTITIVRRDAMGRPITRWILEDALAVGFSTQESPGQFVSDSVSLDFTTLKIQRLSYASNGSPLPTVTIQWVEGMGTGTGTSTDFGGQTFPAGSEPETTLDLGSGQFAVNSFSWGESLPTGGTLAGQSFSFSTLAGVGSLGLTGAVWSGSTIPQAIFTTRDPDGHIVTQWLLTNVVPFSYQTNSSTGAPGESTGLHYQSVTLLYNAYAPAVVVDPVAPSPRNTAVGSLVLRFSEPVSGLDRSDLNLSRDGGANLLTAQQTLATADGGRTWTLGNLSAITSAADGTYTLSISTDIDAAIVGQYTTQPLAQASGATWVLDRLAPTLSGKTFDYVASPNRLNVTFSENLQKVPTKNDLSVKALGAGAPPVPAITGFVYDPNIRTAVWTFASNLADGNYQATLTGGSAIDLAGNPIAISTVDFFALTGDANHDRKVDFLDLATLAQSYNVVGRRTFDQGDFNYDFKVDFLDLALMAQRYNTTLAAPGAPVPAAVATASFAADWAAVSGSNTPATTAPPVPVATKPAKPKPKPIFNTQPPIKIPPKPLPKKGARISGIVVR
jgi:type VI protein secretion system component Hcp